MFCVATFYRNNHFVWSPCRIFCLKFAVISFVLRTQNNLLRQKTKLCYSLSSAYYSFGHDGTTVLEQEEYTGLTTGLAEFILSQAPYAINMGKVQYDIYYKPPWATSTQLEERHKQVYTEIGTSLKGRYYTTYIHTYIYFWYFVRNWSPHLHNHVWTVVLLCV